MFEPVHTLDQTVTVARLARRIWLQHFSLMLGRQTVEDMLERLQSPAAVQAQIAEGCAYYLIRPDARAAAAGYLATRPQPESSRMLLSKLYILRSHRGRGLAQKALGFVEQQTRAAGLRSIVLTVYPGNHSAIAAYERIGFNHAGTIHRKIGAFEVDDVFMSKAVL